MKTEISRDSFRPGQRYSGVYLQQGRMILDTDWNELTEVQKARLADALRDAISGTLTPAGAIPGGAPRVGGLKVFADPADPTKILVQPGTLYVEGVPARLDAPAPLAPDEQPDYPLQAAYSGQNLRLYADVWDRCVTALEQSALLDPALHGADTGTRTQTMLQVKWCPDTTDPLDEDANPALGNAPLTLKLRLIVSSGDPCDPCASQATADERIGNYLFRVEVHDYEPATGWLTLKWSRDNGAEACSADAMPPGFDQGDWVWEFFDDDTERLLGNHFAPGPVKLRGLIRESAAAPTGAHDPTTYVRQWDGYIRIKLGDGSLSGRDRGVALFVGAVDDQAHGRVNFSGGVLRINLDLMELELIADGKRFVPGDYWLAEVREARDESGSTVLAAASPRGVRHHYLYLGELGVDKKLKAEDGAFTRRMAFPPLTDVHADDVAFSDHCPGLFSGAVNVQQALDNLCAIGAEDIAYLLPDCGADEGASIKDRLKSTLDPNADGKLTVQAALDALLCQLNAGALPLDKGDTGLCSDLRVSTVATVQDALKVLCERSGGGCAVVADSPEHLEVLLKDFAAGDATDLWVCLKGDGYTLTDPPAIAGKRSLRISGEGPESVAVRFSGETLALGADEVILENLSLTFASGWGRLAITADTVQIHGCHFSRTTMRSNGPAMVSVSGSDGGACRMSWRDNALYAQLKTVSGAGDKWAGPTVVGDAQVSRALLALGSDRVLEDKSAYDAALSKAVDAVMAMSAAKRRAWKTALDHAAPPGDAVIPMVRARVPTAESTSIRTVLAKTKMSRAEIAIAVENLAALWVAYTPDYALRLEDADVGGVMEDCQVDGWLLLGNGIDGYASPSEVQKVTLDGPVVDAGDADLRLRGNTLTAVKANLPEGALNAQNVLVKQVTGYPRLLLLDNCLLDAGNVLTAATFVGQGNTWSYRADAGGSVGYALSDRASFTGNVLEGHQESAALSCSVRGDLMADAGNVLVRLVSIL